MESLIDSKFHIGEEIWYVNGSTVTKGIVATVLYNYNTEQVNYMLRKNESAKNKGKVSEDRVFDSKEAAEAFLLSQPIRKVERESELLAAINSYVDLGELVKCPLIIKLCDGWGRDEVGKYLREKYKTLGVDGHPFKRGHKHFINEKGEGELISNHPELTANFFPPSGFDALRPPLFFIHNSTHDYLWNPSYYLECVQKLKIPFVLFAPFCWIGGDYTKPEEQFLEGPEIISTFETVQFSPTVKGWLKDMDEPADLPNQTRLIETSEDWHLLYGFNDESGFWRNRLTPLRPHFLEQRVRYLLDYANSIKDIESLDDILDTDLFNGNKHKKESIPYFLERLFGVYYTMFIGRSVCPDVEKTDVEKKLAVAKTHFSNLFASFTKYLENTEDKWVFDFSKPVPESVISKVKELLKASVE